MDEQPRYNRILGYKPENNRATFELAPNQYGSVAVINCAKVSAQDPVLPEYTKNKHSQWHSGRSIRINRTGDRGTPVATADSRGVYHRNCMWFDIEIDKDYLDQNAVTHVDTILRGNVSDNMIHSSIWWPVSSGLPDFTGPNTQIGPDEPENPLTPLTGGPTIWIQTESTPADPIDGGAQNDVPVAIWSYSKIIGYTNPGTPAEEPIYDWEIIYGNENAQGLYNTTTINNIPTFVFNPSEQCRFVVQVHWNQNYAHTAIDREVALYVFKGDTDNTRALNDYIVKSPIVRMRNQANPGKPAYNLPTQKGFKPAELLEYYFDPRFKNLSIPITNTEIVMDIISGTATVDPSDDYENAVQIDLVGDGAELKLHYGPGSEAWVMAPVSDGEVTGNFPYYIGRSTQSGTEIIWLPTDEAGVLTLSGPGRYSVYGSDALLPQTPEIAEWLSARGWPLRDYQPIGKLTQHPTAGVLEDTQQLTNITSWQDILITTGYRMFRNVSGDFNLPGYQGITNLTEMFEGCSDFTGQGDIGTWLTDQATLGINTFLNCVKFNADISAWNMSNVYSLSQMFYNAQSFNQPLNSWDVSSAVIFNGMFKNAQSFNQPLNTWNTALAEGMSNMFENASAFDQDISEWPVPKIPNKPANFDTNTLNTWIIWEKPWWGIANKPTGPYMVLDWGGDLRVDTCDLTIYKPTKELYRRYTVNLNDPAPSHYISIPSNYIIFGTATSVSMMSYSYSIEIPEDLASQGFSDLPGERLYNGYYMEDLHPFQKDMPNYFLDTESELADYAQSLIQESQTNFDDSPTEFKEFLSNNGWGNDNYLLENFNKIFLTMGPGAFNSLGTLPDDMPTDIVFADKDDVFDRTFQATTNIPGPEITDTWVIPQRSTLSMDYICRWSPDATNADHFIKRIIDQASVTSFTGAFVGVDTQVLDFSQSDTSTQITSLKNAYSFANITGNQGSVMMLDTTQNTNTQGMFAFATTDTPTSNFVRSLRMATNNVTDMSLMFSHTDVVPQNCSTQNNIWDVSNVTNLMCMFMYSKFPEEINEWQLINTGKFLNTYLDDSNRLRFYLDTGDWGMFLGATGTAQSMTAWNLGSARRYTYDVDDWQTDTIKALSYDRGVTTPGGITLYAADYDNAISKAQRLWIDNLCPAWFALTPDFNTDISSWARSYYAHPADPEGSNPIEKTTIVRDYTFAWSKSFNQQIDWYFPPEHYLPLGYVNPDLRSLVSGEDYVIDPTSGQQVTEFIEAWNPWKKDIHAMAFSSISNVFKWWKTFTGSVWNNGGQTLPTIMADNMCSTFRDSAIDNNITIRKPGSGQGWYSRLFEGTQNWSGSHSVDWQMQNRVDTPGLENPYYHTIFADRMFKNSTFNGVMGSGWIWFWYNVTNVHGYSAMAGGIDEEFIGWADSTQRDQAQADLQVPGAYTSINRYNSIHNATGVYQHDTLKGAPWSQIPCETSQRLRPFNFPVRLEKNSYLGATTHPVLSFQVFRLGVIRTDVAAPSYRSPGHAMETFNLREMFMGSTFDQDLSSYRTRWSPIKGAFTPNETDDWLNENTYTGFANYKPQQRPYNVCGENYSNPKDSRNGFGRPTYQAGSWWNAHISNRNGQDLYGTSPMTYYAPTYGKYYPDVTSGAPMKPVSKQEYDGITYPYAYEMTFKTQLTVNNWVGNSDVPMWIHYIHHPKTFSDELNLPQSSWPQILSQGITPSQNSYFGWTDVTTLANWITLAYQNNQSVMSLGGFSLYPRMSLPGWYSNQVPDSSGNNQGWPAELGPKN